MSSVAKYSLPQLPYACDALEPAISAQIMILHHSKHHQAYINNLNIALGSQATAFSKPDIVAQLHLQEENLTPASSASSQPSLAPKIMSAINARWGSLQKFQETFNATLVKLKGSGWGWLVQDVDSHALEITTSKDQDIVPEGKKPLLGIDMWEHAYYLQYLNDKGSYAREIWKVINWKKVEERFESGTEGIFGPLAGLKSAI